MSWLKVLKYVAQVAVALGLDKEVKGWIKGKAKKTILKAEAKMDEKFKDLAGVAEVIGEDDLDILVEDAVGRDPSLREK